MAAHEHHHHPPDEPAAEAWSYCEAHPNRETALRCNKCGRYMCVDCAVQTPVGYRCRECVREQENRFFTGTNVDYIIIFAVSFALSILGGLLISIIRFLLFAIILSAPIAGAIGEAALRAVRRRRGRYSGRVAATGAALGALLSLFFAANLSVLIFAVIAVSVVYSRFQLKL